MKKMSDGEERGFKIDKDREGKSVFEIVWNLY